MEIGFYLLRNLRILFSRIKTRILQIYVSIVFLHMPIVSNVNFKNVI